MAKTQKSKAENMVSKPYSLPPSMVKRVERHAAELTLVTNKRVSASEIVRKAVAFYMAAQEADGSVRRLFNCVKDT
jgi:hypothetical protein